MIRKKIMKSHVFLAILGIGLLALLLTAPSSVKAQSTCVDPVTGLPIACPPTKEPAKKTPRPTNVPASATFTVTATSTVTSTKTPSPTATATSTTTNTPTNTPTVTPTFTPTPPGIAMAVLPGAGIGLFILLLIVGIFLPIGQKIRVTRRGY
jgi:carbohydrate-binding DOMON domain-containing protein